MRVAGKQVDDPAEVLAAADRHLDRNGSLAERIADLLKRLVEARVLPVHHADEHHARNAAALGGAPAALRPYLDS